MPTLKRFQESLPVELTKTEWSARSMEMATKLKELGDQQARAAEKKKALAAEEKDLEKEITRLGDVVRTSREPRMVDCYEAVEGEDTIAVYRSDTGAFVRSRAMTEDEVRSHRQGRLAFDEGDGVAEGVGPTAARPARH